jgi:hypothetical protein
MVVKTFHHTVSANTSYENAEEEVLKLAPGVLTHAIVTYPAGHQFLARSQVLDGLLNVIPGTEGEYLTGEDATDTIPIFYSLGVSPHELTWKLWNLDDTYDHQFVMKLIILPDEIASNVRAMEKLTDEVQQVRRILTGETPGPLSELQTNLAELIKLLPVETAPTPKEKIELK